MSHAAQTLILVDARLPLPDQEAIVRGTLASTDTLLGLPLKRDALRTWAGSHGVELQGEVLLELESDTRPQFLLEKALQLLRLGSSQHVLTLDRRLLEGIGIYEELMAAAQQLGCLLHDVPRGFEHAPHDATSWGASSEELPFALHLPPS